MRFVISAFGRLASAALLAKVVGLADQIVISRAFGTSADMDSLVVISLVPFLVASILASAVESGFMPLFIQARTSSDTEAGEFLVGLLCWGGAALVVLTLIGMWGAPLILRATAPGLDDRRIAAAVQLAPVVYPIVVLYVLSTVLTVALNAQGRFGVGGMTQVVVPIIILISVWGLADRFGILAMAGGQLVGFAVQCLFVLAISRRLVRHVRLRRALADPRLRLLTRRALPIVVGGAVLQANPVIDQFVLSSLPAGYLSAVNYALKLIAFPQAVVFSALAMAAFPHFSERVARQDWGGLKASLRLYMWIGAALSGAGMLITLLFGRPIIALVFQHGAFTPESGDLTAGALYGFALGFVPMCLGYLVPRAYAALNMNQVLAWVTVFSVALNLALDLLLVGPLAQFGVALATSVVYAATLGMHIVLLRRRLGPLHLLQVPPELRRLRTRLIHRRAGALCPAGETLAVTVLSLDRPNSSEGGSH